MEDKLKFEEWDIIYRKRNEYVKEFSSEKIFQNIKTFIDKDKVVRCSTCGVKDDIHKCFECINDMIK